MASVLGEYVAVNTPVNPAPSRQHCPVRARSVAMAHVFW